MSDPIEKTEHEKDGHARVEFVGSYWRFYHRQCRDKALNNILADLKSTGYSQHLVSGAGYKSFIPGGWNCLYIDQVLGERRHHLFFKKTVRSPLFALSLHTYRQRGTKAEMLLCVIFDENIRDIVERHMEMCAASLDISNVQIIYESGQFPVC